MVNKAAFSLEGYRFEEVHLELQNIRPSSNFDVDFLPSGIFNSQSGVFRLSFTFTATTEASGNPVVVVKCVAFFKFENIHKLDEIPEYFYANSIAIMFPYIRAFISTITLQANIQPLLLPTLNLSSLQTKLKQNTTNE